MTGGFDPGLFAAVFGLIFLAELPDKTALAIVALAARKRPSAVFAGAAAAFLVQTAVAVAFGGLLSALPRQAVRIGSGTLFLAFAALYWLKTEEETAPEGGELGGSFRRAAWTSFAAVFAAEWGDLTQLATAALEAKHRAPLTIFLAAGAALWTVAALAAALGRKLRRHVHPERLSKAAALAFALVGAALLLRP